MNVTYKTERCKSLYEVESVLNNKKIDPYKIIGIYETFDTGPCYILLYFQEDKK